MKKGLIRKGLVLSVIILFISVGVQPVFARESITSTLDKEEDCIECEEINNIQLFKLKLQLTRLKAIANFIYLKFGEIPKVAELCQNIMDIKSIYDYPIFCGILTEIYINAFYLMIYMGDLIHDLNLEETRIGIIIQLTFVGIYGFFWSLMLMYCYDETVSSIKPITPKT